MALFKISIKRTFTTNGIHLEKGMSVELPTSNSISNPFGSIQCKEQIAEAFKRKYGIDVVKACALSTIYMEVKKM